MRVRRSRSQRAILPFAAIVAAALASTPARAQGSAARPASPVRYTEAREHDVRRTVQLPGSVESRTVSIVAAETEGLVTELRVRDGDTVRKGEPMARLRTTMLELRLAAATAQLKEATSRLRQSEVTLERVRGLFESKVASQQEFDTASYEATAWQGHAENLEAEIARIKLTLDLCTIRAPFAGLVVSKRTEVGQWIPTGGPVVEMLSLDELEVRVEVPERYFSSLNPGAPATVTFESLPGLKVNGQVSTVVPRADPQARTFPLKVRVPNREGRIGVGMLAQVSFPAGESYRATVVPKDAVVSQGAERFVFLIDGDDTVKKVSVQPGDGVGSWIVVQGELRAGQKVVTRGNERLFPGVKVQGQPLEYALP